ncbi:MAG TPA: hypothetical protein VJ731_10660 [Terriglobales bacterium]|nr:hypothetical protein [Terriglobales bacterium]
MTPRRSTGVLRDISHQRDRKGTSLLVPKMALRSWLEPLRATDSELLLLTSAAKADQQAKWYRHE